MDLSIKSESFGVGDKSWLLSRHALDTPRPVMLHVPAFTKATHYPDGFLKSGIPLGKIAGTNTYGPYGSNTTEVQTVTVTGAPTGGTFTLTLGGQTTAGIARNATPSAVRSALEALSSVRPGDVAVTGAPGAYSVRFLGQYAGEDVAQMTASGAGLTGGSSPNVTVATGTGGGSSATDGTNVLVGHLFDEEHVNDGAVDIGGSMFIRGDINTPYLPLPVDEAGRAQVAGRIFYS